MSMTIVNLLEQHLIILQLLKRNTILILILSILLLVTELRVLLRQMMLRLAMDLLMDTEELPHQQACMTLVPVLGKGVQTKDHLPRSLLVVQLGTRVHLVGQVPRVGDEAVDK